MEVTTAKDETTDMARLSLSEQARGDDAPGASGGPDDSDASSENGRKRKNYDDSDDSDESDSDESEDSCDSQDLEEIEDLMGKIQEEREKNQALARAVVKMQQNNLQDPKRRKMFDHIMSLQEHSGDKDEKK